MSGQMRILVVDDEPSMRKSLADILLDEGYEVTTAEDGHAAVALCADREFDVILMDVRMPGISGVEAFREIRRHRAGVRVILMSAYGMEDLKQIALDEGAVAFLDKPLDIDKLIDLIERAEETPVLIVEVDDSTSAVLQDGLKRQGYHVTVTTSPHEAVDLVEQIRFGVILIDVDLPVMNGLDLYLTIKRLTPASIAIMIAGSEEEFEQLARDAVDRTAYAFVQKPIDLDHLLDLLDRIRRQQASGVFKKPEQ